MNWKLFSLSTVLLLFGASPSISQVRLEPLVIETNTERGLAQGVIQVTNPTNEEFRARVYSEPFTYSRDNGFVVLEESEEQDLTPYLQFSPTELVVPPGTSRSVRMIARMPPSLPEGEYRAVIFTENLVETQVDATTGAVTNIVARVGATVYVRQGDVTPDVAVAEVGVHPEINWLQLLISNEGKATARLAVNWTLSQDSTELTSGVVELATVVAESERNVLLEFPTETDEPLPPGLYQLQGNLVWIYDDQEEIEPFELSFDLPTTLANAPE